MKKLTLFSFLYLLLMANISGQAVRSGKSYIPIHNNYGKYYALVIGINNYSDPDLNRLKKPRSEADLFYNIITTRYTFEKENVTFLLDANMAKIKEALDSISKRVGPADNFLIFFAGQGYWDATSEAGFWLPSDAQGIGFWFISSDEKENTRLAWLSNSMLNNYLNKIKSKHTLLITDASFGGSVFNAQSVSSDPMVEVNTLNGLTGRKAITSGMILYIQEQGDFLSNLLVKLKENTEKYLASEKLFKSIPETVSDSTNIIPRFGEIKNLGDEGGDFIFILRNK